MISLILNFPWFAGFLMFLFMWMDWILTILQERERQLNYARHYESYPIDTIEGSPSYQLAVTKRRIIEPRHIIPAIILGSIISVTIYFVPVDLRGIFIGYVWGIFLIVITTHIGNLIGYVAARRGLHGKLFLHQRTGYIIQMGRYFALTIFLILLAIISGSLFIVGVAAAGITTTIRQLIWMRRIPPIDTDDLPPKSEGTT
jgi:hypothetical protein